MKCRRAKQLIFDFLDGVIADRDRVNLERHLNECKPCETFTSQVARSLDLLHRIPEETPSENFNWKVRLRLAREKNAIGDAVAAQREIFRSWNLRFALSALSTFVLILASGYFLWSSGFIPDTTGPTAFSKQKPVETRQQQTTHLPNIARNTPDLFGRSVPSIGSPVSAGSESYSDHSTAQGAIDTLILDPDSLVMMKLRSLPMRHRVRQLEGQVEQLQQYLRECETNCGGEQR